MKIRAALLVGMWLPAAAFLAGCSTGANSKVPPPPAAVPVRVKPALQKDVPIRLRAIGTVEAYSTVAVKTMVSGPLTKIGFREGQDVRKGDLLFEIDPRSYEAALRSAEANLARDVALKKNAEAEKQRYSFLVDKDLVPRQQYDTVAANADALEATVKADAAQVENARVQLDYCIIRSPIDGRTGSLLVQRGNVVKANDTTLVVIHQVSPIYVSFSLPERHLAEIRSRAAAGRLAVDAVLPGEEKTPARGTLTFISNAIDNATGTILMKGTFPNDDRRLWPGQFANAALRLGTVPKAVVVPSEAVQAGQEGNYLFVIRPDQTAEVRPVTTGQAMDGETVIEKGVRPGEQVVTDGQLRLSPGVKVVIKKEAAG